MEDYGRQCKQNKTVSAVDCWNMNNNNDEIIALTQTQAVKENSQARQQEQQQQLVGKQGTVAEVAKTKLLTGAPIKFGCVGKVEDEGGGGECLRLMEKNEKHNGAASLSLGDLAPILDASVIGISSSRTSINNSTENLSYSSDNYYPDDLILLDDDVDAEEISLNSDDCVYAYRGGGADYEFAALDAIAGRGGAIDAHGLADDETDFLEMDFEPDPLSEVEYGSSAMDHSNPYLMQRDFSHLSGRHSVHMSLQATPTQRQHFSSPIEDLPPQEALQSQAAHRLSKNFARISLHLDQIKGGEFTESEESSTANMLSVDDVNNKEQTAHSLPNTLYANFGREGHEKSDSLKSPSKITGAKPKRFSTFSTSSSISSRNSSSKSRSSFRTAFAPVHNTISVSFDERSVSCTDFRTAAPTHNPTDICAPMLVAAAAAVAACATNKSGLNIDLNTNDETCLDCLEKEFLANTIGKEMDSRWCKKCRKRCSSISLYTRAERAAASARCRSGSPTYFLEHRDDSMFDAANIQTLRQRSEQWPALCGAAGTVQARMHSDASLHDKDSDDERKIEISDVVATLNQRGAMCDSFSSSEQLLRNSLLMTEPEVVRISTVNLNEEALVQALDKLRVPYNVKLVKSYFANAIESQMYLKNLKDLILRESKKYCNYPRLKKLIELSTGKQVTAQFKKNPELTEKECVSVKVSDILQQWLVNKNLAILAELDKRFINANILGKVANFIRQTQDRSFIASTSTHRPLPEFISIPQYYPSGELTLIKKC